MSKIMKNNNKSEISQRS